MNLHQLAYSVLLGAPLALAPVLSACVSSETDDPAADSQASSESSSSNASNSGSGGSSASTSSETNTTGSEPDCSAAPTISTPLITDFETYDGDTPADEWNFSFNGEDGMGAVYAGPFELEDSTGDYSLTFVTGADGSTWALSAQNSMVEDWGGGIGLWMGCFDASSYTGVEFMIKGSSPPGSGEVSLGLSGDISVSSKFDMPADWTLMQVPFTNFRNDAGGTTNGSGIIRMSFQAHMTYVQDSTGEWVPEPGEFEIAIDNLGFY